VQRMTWEFETEPDFQEQLDWINQFIRTRLEPLDFVVTEPNDFNDPVRQRLIPPLQEEVKAHGLWACHLGPELGGQGYGQLKLALMNELIGRARCAPMVFGCQAPDSGNAEIIARYGTPEQKQLYLWPLLGNKIVSAFSMTEPHGGADPKVFTTRAELDGDEWVINGEKWFTSNARYSTLLLLLAVTEPNAPSQERMSMFLVPTATPGVEIVRNVGIGSEHPGEGNHGYVRYTGVRIPKDNLLGERGQGFAVAQTRLGGGRVHHAMRTVGQVGRAFDMMLERAVSRQTQGELLGKKQLVQAMIADSWIDLESFRLMVLRTAWRIDKLDDYKQVRKDIAAVKVMAPKVLHDVAVRALQVHGSLGVSNEMPFTDLVIESFLMGLVDGPSEVHKVTIARELERGVEPAPGIFPSTHLPTLRQRAFQQYGPQLQGL
jgi:acyl-CoA dehydrogenase